MIDIETKISPLVESMFPSFYKEEGPDFITFVKAYYEWLEQNHQLLSLDDNTGFDVGDTITQANTTGIIVAEVGDDRLVYVNGIDTFKCVTVCSSLDPIVSSSGAETYILRGGLTKRLGALFIARNLMDIRDVDTTIDIFINFFKEKYLKNIEFNMLSNKQLLIKHASDLYRSKGTERSIDLFFRLVYGVKSQVYYPGDDLFKLSAGEWVKPQYIEIREGSKQRAIALVGKQITGVTSGATAFVEKYIIRKIQGGSVHILYVSNVVGEFETNEILKDETIYSDSPRILGSLTSVEVVTGSRLYEVGDIVSFTSTTGLYGLARVSAVEDSTGAVDFLLIDGGYGFSAAADTLVSEKVITVTNVAVTNVVSDIVISAGGSGYSNSDRVVVPSTFVNAMAIPVTNSTGGIVSLTIYNQGGGFVDANPSVVVVNSSGGSSSGSSATFVANTARPSTYFKYFDTLTQPKYSVTYDSAANSSLLAAGSTIKVGNSSTNVVFGKILTNETTSNTAGTLEISVSNSSTFTSSNLIYLTSNLSITANVTSVTDISPYGTIMGLPDTATFSLGSVTGTAMARGDEIYQLDEANNECGNGIITIASNTSIEVSPINGMIRPGATIQVRDKTSSANVTNITLKVGLVDIVNTFSDTYGPITYTNIAGVTANISGISTGSSANYTVGSLIETESVPLNTDLLSGNNTSDVPYLDLPLNSAQYGFPKNPGGNSSSVIYSCLNFDTITIGIVDTLADINPGTGYNEVPYVLTYQPYIVGFGKKDYILSVSNTSGTFTVGEKINQTSANITNYSLELTDETGYSLGEKVYQGTSGSETARGTIIEITPSTNTIIVANTTGTFIANTLHSYITPALSANVISIDTVIETVTATGIVKASNSSTVSVKRIQYSDYFTEGSLITGRSSGATATIDTVSEDEDSLPIGINADISANVSTSSGTISSLEIIDSGLRYSNAEIMLFSSNASIYTGEAKAILGGLGTGSGYYKTSKGFLSSISKLHDGDYYQEYSYDVMSAIPITKYGEMFKKVMHVAGTRFFGSILVEKTLSAQTAITSQVTEETT